MASQQMVGILWIVLLFGLMWFLLIRPQQAQQRRRQQMIASVRAGDRIVTAGGIVGMVTAVRENSFLVRIADRVEVELQRSGVGYVMSSPGQEKEKGKEEGNKE
ncbi:MAG: preprotein translocase subunit YajC [Bacillota bacterium]|nr:preprotein translocase subunit YajC [Bacillota bacterium]